MPKPTPKEIREHRAFLKRQQLNEEIYLPLFFKYLNKVYANASRIISKDGPEAYMIQMTSDQYTKQLTALYVKLYSKEIIKEAEIESKIIDDMAGQKDMIDQFAKLGTQRSEWQRLLLRYLRDRIAIRVVEVTKTTIKHLSKIIRESMENGDGAKETAKKVRDSTKFNKNRSLAIARTETVSAMNEGKYIAALSSKFEMVKRWMPTDDKRTRNSHREFLDSGFIDMSQFFEVNKRKGGVDIARYPGDDSLSAENVINCRCSISFKLKINSDGNVIRK
ncbi:phage minor capsid protein [Cellulophaga phage phi18:2]|uniref:Phage minor capsid protein n=2 Tax=Cellulophaga phage phi18:1 TaxID=1327982 RepID=S0A434_9CAUD|nr:head morphogenesis [Cellulophaga phage phi18:1]AGO48483.1 phage minor capsid protein [Cellulophaga phage phi18:1]AGO49197.1 phage minor capsid protein [Cellulophaga phage phi18:2]